MCTNPVETIEEKGNCKSPNHKSAHAYYESPNLTFKTLFSLTYQKTVK